MSESFQSELPVHEEPRSLDYFPEGDEGVSWTVKDWRNLREAFSIESHELNDWHQIVSGQGRNWTVVKRIFGVMAHFGEASEEEDMEDWDWSKLSKSWSVAEKVLRDELDALVDYWKRQRISRRIVSSAPVNPVDAGAAKAGLADEKIDELLRLYRFDYIASKPERLFIATRLTELKPLMEDKHRREGARQLINMELHLSDSEASRAALKRRLDAINTGKTEFTKEQAKEILDLSKALSDHEKTHTALTEKYLRAAAEIGEEEMEEGELRKVAIGTVSHMIEHARKCHMNHDMTLVDGVFAADEVIWQTTNVPLRPAQYRPDLVLRIREAMMPENLWNPDYRPTVIPREACRRMLKLAKMLTEEEDQTRIPEIDDDSSTEEGESEYPQDSEPSQAVSADDSSDSKRNPYIAPPEELAMVVS